MEDPEFASKLSLRSNNDLKYKWKGIKKRGTTTSHGQGSRGRSFVCGPASSSLLGSEEEKKDDILPGGSQILCLRLDEMLLEALQYSNDVEDGFALELVVDYITNKYGPQNVELLNSKLMELVSQGKHEQFLQGYKINKDAWGTQMQAPKQKDVGPSSLIQPTVITGNYSVDDAAKEAAPIAENKEIEDAAKEAARLVAEAENKAMEAAEAVRCAEMMSQMLEENLVMLALVEDILALCPEEGDYVIVRFD